jgi:aldose 1-epimerase
MKFWLVFLAACLCIQPAVSAATVTHADWGQDAAGAPVELYTIASAKAEVKVTTYGARIVSIRVPNRKGEMGDVVLGHDSVQGYMNGGAVMGATIGRYANRIDHGQFTLDGQAYHILTGANSIALHGGTVGFDVKTWAAKQIPDGVEMTLVSPDGDMGFPGSLTMHVRFTLVEFHGDPALKIEYLATTDKPTVVNFTNHSYFNLGDDSSTPVFGDQTRIDADSYTPFDSRSIPTGEIASVAGTPYDFRNLHAISEQMPERGWDGNFVLRAPGLKMPAAEVDDLTLVLHDGRKRIRLQARAAYQRAVNLFLTDQRRRIVRLDAAAVENAHGSGDIGSQQLGHFGANDLVRVDGNLRRRRLARADGPHRLIGNHNRRRGLRRDARKRAVQSAS